MKNFKKIAFGLMVLCMLSMPNLGYSADYSSYSTQELAAMRGTLRNASPEERAAFRQEWQKRMQNMTPEERAQYMNSAPRGRGQGMGYGRGQGNCPRYATGGNYTQNTPYAGSGFRGGRGYGRGRNMR